MIFYYSFWALHYMLTTFLGAIFRSSKLISFFGIIPVLLIILLRDNVGTDTANYLRYFESIKSGELDLAGGWEPGFILVAYFFSTILDLPSAMVMALINSLTCLFLYISWSRTNSHPIYFLLLVAPIFYIELTFDAVRLGLGLSVALLGLNKIRKDIKVYIFYMFFGTLFHYSVAIFALIFYILNTQFNLKYFIFLLPILLLAGAIEERITPYIGYESANWYSGISVCICILFALFILFSQNKNKIMIVIKGIILMLMFYGVAQFSVAGLRMLHLLNYALIFMILFEANLSSRKIKTSIFVCCLILSILNNYSVVRTYPSSIGFESSYIPYKTLIN